MTTERRVQPSKSTRPLLATDINTATRPLHTKLNRLITDRLPLALPPHSASPYLYKAGLLHFAHVYLTFEPVWIELRDTSRPLHGIDGFLSELLDPRLLRSDRLRRDLEALLGSSPDELQAQLARAAHPGNRVAEYAEHIRGAVTSRPHVLIAYAWVMYMALFAGGRWIRKQLKDAGKQFWESSDNVGDDCDRAGKTPRIQFDSLDDRGLAFFNFDGDADGVDIKNEFKERFGNADTLLSKQQRDEVVDEAKAIFMWSIALVEELDELLQTPGAAVARDNREKAPMAMQAAVAPKSWASIAGALFVQGGDDGL